MRLARVVYQFTQHWEIKEFYANVLEIETAGLINYRYFRFEILNSLLYRFLDQLDNLTWCDVLQKLCAAQKNIQLCIHKDQLTELDIYQRILRHKNYMISMVIRMSNFNLI